MNHSLPSHIKSITLDRDLLVCHIDGDIQPFVDPSLLATLVESSSSDLEADDEALDHARFIGLDIRDLFPELYGSEEWLSDVADGLQPEFSIKSIGRFPDNRSPLYLDIYALPMDVTTETSYLRLLIEDVTDRMSLEQVLVQATNENHLLIRTLESTKLQLNKIISAMTEILIVVSESGFIQLVNSATTALFGYDESELVGKPLSMIIAVDTLDQSMPLNSLFGLHEGEITCQKKNGESLIIAFSRSTLTTVLKGQAGQEGEVKEFLYVGRDITHEKQQQRYQEIQHLVTRIMSESAMATQALSAIMRTICQEFSWQVGEFWIADRTEFGIDRPTVCCMDCWVSKELSSIKWHDEIQSVVALPNQQLIGKIWQSGRCLWSNNIDELAPSDNADVIRLLDLKTGFGFPIQSGGKILGLLVFFKQDVQIITQDLLDLGDSLGEQLGQYLERRRTEEALLIEQERSERLLLNILPEPIARSLKQNTRTIAEQFANVTVLFADIVGFTEIAATLSPINLVELLNEIFSEFDRLTEIYNLEKIKTIGDSYMVVAGLPTPRDDHADAVAAMALDMQTAIQNFNSRNQRHFQIRIGIHSGSVVAGVIGLKKFIYDLWGDTVNTASRMESHGIAGTIQVSEDTYQLLKRAYELEPRGSIEIKGKGEMKTYFLTRKSQTHLASAAP